jgi:hypothetical protein
VRGLLRVANGKPTSVMLLRVNILIIRENRGKTKVAIGFYNLRIQMPVLRPGRFLSRSEPQYTQ